ncbi:ribosome-recycling factor [Mycoplasma wenyonii]|uniref:Ribosome-recycling factor n=1 Tax=Mycoplasma wenyonii TaxID=65123 RepID=A0A328PL19_9MOLU|nr:ribosome-recycling factor [Mycoplasma wenyonii]RAO95084.1 ribosome-recycling factor [Mycoplasma wenyonii]
MDSSNWAEHLKQDFSKIRLRMLEKLEEFSILRLNPKHFYSIKVEQESSLSPLAELASINLESARMLHIKPYVVSQKSLHEIEKAIKKAKPNVTINSKDNELICSIPEPTAEIREEKIKSSKQVVEEARIALRTKRQDLLKKFKNWYPSENELHSNKNSLEKEISRYLSEIESEWTNKEKEFRQLK